MDTTEYLALVEGGVGTFTIEYHSDTRPAAAHRERRLRKVVTAICLTGLEYRNLRVNKGIETGPLPWGTWQTEPFVIEHKGQTYARLYCVENGVRAVYTCDGEVIDRSTYEGYLTPSQRSAPRPNGGCITVRMSGMRAVGEPSFT